MVKNGIRSDSARDNYDVLAYQNPGVSESDKSLSDRGATLSSIEFLRGRHVDLISGHPPSSSHPKKLKHAAFKEAKAEQHQFGPDGGDRRRPKQ